MFAEKTEWRYLTANMKFERERVNADAGGRSGMENGK
jgi:hypothetical protein